MDSDLVVIELDLSAIEDYIKELKTLAQMLDNRPSLPQLEGSGLFVEALNISAKNIPAVEAMIQRLILKVCKALDKIYSTQLLIGTETVKRL